MGAAGLTSSSAEMAARGGVGVELETDRVPTREPGMTPYEIMLSESQERMLIVARKGREDEVRKVFAKWSLDAAIVGDADFADTDYCRDHLGRYDLRHEARGIVVAVPPRALLLGVQRGVIVLTPKVTAKSLSNSANLLAIGRFGVTWLTSVPVYFTPGSFFSIHVFHSPMPAPMSSTRLIPRTRKNSASISTTCS